LDETRFSGYKRCHFLHSSSVLLQVRFNISFISFCFFISPEV
jgi:hypothetical protein